MRSNNTIIQQVKFNIEYEIKERKLTTKKVCERLKVDRFYIYRMTDRTPLEKIVKIAEAIGCTPSDLLKGI